MSNEHTAAELERLRAVVKTLRADPAHHADMETVPPLSAHARHVIAWAFCDSPGTENAAA